MHDVLTETAPERIWLQIDPNGDPHDRNEPCPDPREVELTWCHEQIGGQEVEYVRADLVRAALPVNAKGPDDPVLCRLAQLLNTGHAI